MFSLTGTLLQYGVEMRTGCMCVYECVHVQISPDLHPAAFTYRI